MPDIKSLIKHLRTKEYYVRLIEILVLNGLLDIFEEEVKDGKINYINFTVNLLEFLKTNSKYYRNFSSDKFENIIILSVDEILTKKFKIDLDEEQLELVLKLVRNSYLFKSLFIYVKDFFIKIYYKIKFKSCYKNDLDNVVIDVHKS